MKVLQMIRSLLEKITDGVGVFAMLALLLMMLNIFVDVFMRYALNSSSIFAQELEWHFFALMFLFGISYAMRHDSHVRVDVFYERFSVKKKALINALGMIAFVIPIMVVIMVASIDFVGYAIKINEGSPDPGGIPYRFIIKSAIPLSIFFVILQALAEVIKNLEILLRKDFA